jgi:3',5'-cyclic AMP phosphodiesterase CpdA
VAFTRAKLGISHRDPRPPPPTDVDPIGDDVRIAILGDWGTGCYGAEPAAYSIAEDGHYDVLIHLGDVYYSGTAKEIDERFLAKWRIMTKANQNAISRACNSNHEMYSGGGPYFSKTLSALHQPSPMFALRNKSWLIVGLDSAYYDHDLDDEQMLWFDRLLIGNPQLRVVLLSHHQPFSQLAGQGEHLVERLRPYLDAGRVFAWYWGHEHLLALYEKTSGWPFHGRCVGHSGFPYSRDDRLGDKAKEDLKQGLCFRTLPARGFEDDPVRVQLPGARVLDGPNQYIGDHKDDYGPNGYMRIELRDSTLHEVLLAPNGAVLWEADLT